MADLQLDFMLDTREHTGTPSGNVILKVYNLVSGQVMDVKVVPCTLEAMHDTVKALYEEHGDIVVPGNLHGTIYDYEYIHATMEEKLTAMQAQAAAEKAQYELERNRKTAKKVLDMLSSQSFDDFYQGPHMVFIEGEEGCLSEEDMLDLIIHKFIKRF